MHSPSFSCQTSVNRFVKEEVILALGSPKSSLIENIFAIEENQINLPQYRTFNSAHAQSSYNSSYLCGPQIRQRKSDLCVSTQHTVILIFYANVPR